MFFWTVLGCSCNLTWAMEDAIRQWPVHACPVMYSQQCFTQAGIAIRIRDGSFLASLLPTRTFLDDGEATTDHLSVAE